MDTFFQDVRYGIRMLMKSPAFTVVAVITLALGIGANTAIFSVLDAVMLRPLPFPHADRLVSIQEMDLRKAHGAGLASSVSYPNFFDWRAHNHTFEFMSSYSDRDFTLTGTGEAQHLEGEMVSAEFFRTIGVLPAIGRDFRAEEEKPGIHVVVLSHELWQSRLGADPAIVGKTITVNSRPYTVVGVMPAGFALPDRYPPAQLWVTYSTDAEGDEPITGQRGAHLLSVIGRLKPGISTKQGNADLDQIARALAKQYPDENGSRGAVKVESLLQHMVGDTRPALLALLAAVICVLLIACVNTANLLLARATSRSREIAVRAALGAGRIRIVRQLLTESVLLAMAGGALGVLLASATLDALLRLSPQEVPRLANTTIDTSVLLFAAGVAILTGIVFGLVPAIHALRTDLVTSLKQNTRGGGASRGQHRVHRSLVIAETAIGVVLLIGSGLLIRSFTAMLHADPGFNPHNVLTMKFNLPSSRYSDAAQIRFYDNLLPKLRAVPGVVSGGAVITPPMSGDRYGISLEFEGSAVKASERPSADFDAVSPDYFRTLGVPLVAGRDFNAHDEEHAPQVMIVNQAFVRRFLSGKEPIGTRVKPEFSSEAGPVRPPWRTIVGVVGDIKHASIKEDAAPKFFVPYPQGLISNLTMVVRTASAPAGMVNELRGVITSMDPQLAIFNVRSLDENVSRSLATEKFETFLLTVFAGLAFVLTAVGLYGVLAYAVAEQTHDFGVRMALGATTSTVLRLVLRSGVAIAAIGLLIGVVAAIGTDRLLAHALYGVGPVDPLTFAAVMAALMLVCLLASYIPARRAAKVDPMVALRYE